jgi:hypothetical protein
MFVASNSIKIGMGLNIKVFMNYLKEGYLVVMPCFPTKNATEKHLLQVTI